MLKSVTKKCDYVVIGDCDCEAYSYGTYGEKVKKAMMDAFNVFFTPLAERINGESPILVYSPDTGKFPVSITELSGSSTGTRKSLIAAFDLAYQQFAIANQIHAPCKEEWQAAHSASKGMGIGAHAPCQDSNDCSDRPCRLRCHLNQAMCLAGSQPRHIPKPVTDRYGNSRGGHPRRRRVSRHQVSREARRGEA